MKEMYEIIRRVTEGKDTSWMMNAERFDWNPGVFLAGAVTAYEKSGDERILKYLKEWTERHMGEADKQLTVNSTAPLIMLLELYRITKEEKYKKVCDGVAHWIITKAPITADGGLEHTVTEDARFKNQMWADTLFMSVIFIARYGRLTGGEAYTAFAREQLKLHYQVLKDSGSGLFFHGWNGDGKNHMSGALWARANAWITLSTGLILNEIPDEFEGRSRVIASWKEQIKALSACQDPSGGFHTVLNRRESYLETSATAGIAAGIFYGVELGIVGKEYLTVAQKAAHFVKQQIRADGSVDRVSGGTPVLENIEAYFKVELGSALYGQGLTLFMLSFERNDEGNGERSCSIKENGFKFK